MKKSQKGFTLVELIVVIAIIGVLAAILVPSMMGYVKKSRLKKANSNAKLVFNTAAEVCTEQETEGTPIAAGKFVKGDASTLDTEITDALANNGSEAGEFCGEIDSDGDVSLAQWRKGDTDTVVGQWPDPSNDPDNLVSWAG